MQTTGFLLGGFRFYAKHKKIYYLHDLTLHNISDLPIPIYGLLRMALENSILLSFIEELESNPVEQLKLFLLINCIVSKREQNPALKVHLNTLPVKTTPNLIIKKP